MMRLAENENAMILEVIEMRALYRHRKRGVLGCELDRAIEHPITVKRAVGATEVS